MKHISQSKYKYVTKKEYKGKIMWSAVMFKNGRGNGKLFETEKEAAKWVDLRLIEQVKDPVNILVHK